MAEIDLHPDVVRAIRRLSETSVGRRYDRYARKNFKLSGATLAGKTVAGEFGGRSTATGRGVVSSAGARGPGQFIPSTRQDYIKRFGIDPWASDAEAIEGLMRHQLETGVKGYNPGMPTYQQYILGQKLNADDLSVLRGASPGRVGGGRSGGSASPDQVTLPGVSFEQERTDARRQLLNDGISLKSLLNYKQTVNSLQDVPDETFNLPPEERARRSSGVVPLGGGSPGSAGFKISGPDPNRLKPELVSFARKVARVYGKTLTGLDGSSHSKYTVNGRVSEHSTGNATDIFEKDQKELLRMGRAALIAAGMPRAQALRATGGLYNVGNHQIIFLTNEGGNHFDHLHISARRRTRA